MMAIPSPIVLVAPMVGNAIDCNCLGRGVAGSAHRLNGEAIASQAKIFLAAPIGGARRESIALARTPNKNLIDASAPGSCSTDHHGLLFGNNRFACRPFDGDYRPLAIRGTEHRMSVKWAGQVRRRSIEGSYPGVPRKERSVDVWLVISVLLLIDSACDPVPGFIRIAAGECPALKALIGPTEVVAGVASLPVFV